MEELLRRAQSGDLEAYDEIVRRFQDMAVGYAYSVLGDFHLAQDAAQEAFMEAYPNLARVYRPPFISEMAQEARLQAVRSADTPQAA